jgi:hypothetical protein
MRETLQVNEVLLRTLLRSPVGHLPQIPLPQAVKDAKEACYDQSEAQGNNRPAEIVRKVRARVR